MDFILGLLRYETFRFVEGVEGNSNYILSSHRINLRMLPDVIAAEIESSDVIQPSDQDC